MLWLVGELIPMPSVVPPATSFHKFPARYCVAAVTIYGIAATTPTVLVTDKLAVAVAAINQNCPDPTTALDLAMTLPPTIRKTFPAGTAHAVVPVTTAVPPVKIVIAIVV